MRRRTALAREIGLALAGKAVALALLYAAFFGPAHSMRVTTAAAGAHILAPAAAGAGR